LGATAAINWRGAFDALSPWFRVVALDHAGHGGGVRSQRPFRLEDCADDVVRLADVLGIEQVVTVGYSMGGPVALLARRRHQSRVSGLVLCATAARFASDDAGALPVSAAMAASLRMTPPAVRRGVSTAMLRYGARDSGVPPLLVEEMSGHDPAALLEATQALRRFDARPWVAELRCPTASVITTRDGLVPAARQLELAVATGATTFRVDADHLSAVGDPGRFLPVLAAACRSVVRAPGANG
jgi:pimeloyl-ACP methyl ester carboxylesterase